MPKKRLQEIKRSASTARLKLTGGTRLAKSQMAEHLATMLAAHEMSRATIAETGSVEAIDRTWQKNLSFYNNYAAEFLEKANPAELDKCIRKNDGGTELSKCFYKTCIRPRDRIPADTPEKLLASGLKRIIDIQTRMAKGEYATPERKRLALGEIYAVRDTLHTKPGEAIFLYDAKLEKRFPPDISQKAQAFEEKLEQLPDEEIDRLFNKVLHESRSSYGGSIQEEMDRICKTPVHREIEKIQKETDPDGWSMEDGRNALAQMIWLRDHKNYTEEQLREAGESGTRETEVNAILARPGFQRMCKDTNLAEMAYLFLGVDPSMPDGFKPLDEACTLADARQRSFDEVYDPIWNSLKDDPAKGQQMMDAMGQLLSYPDLNNGTTTQCAFADALNELNETIAEDPGNSRNIKASLEKTRALFALFSHNSKEYEAFRKANPAIDNLRGLLQIPETGTAEYYDLYLRGSAVYSQAGGPGNDELFLRKASFYELYGNQKDWKNLRVDEAAINRRTNELQNQNLQVGFLDSYNEKGFALLMDYDGGKNAKEFLDQYRREQEKLKTQTAAERLNDYLTFSHLETRSIDMRNAGDLCVGGLTVRSLWREAQAHPERFKTAQDVDRIYEEKRRAISSISKEGFATGEAVDLIKKNDAAELEALFKKSIVGTLSLEKWKNLDPALMPTAREQIEALQGQFRKNEITDPYWQSTALSQILAAREVMGIQRGMRGGDPKLDKQMTKACFDRAKELREELQALPPEELQELCRKATAGHGGELQEAVDDYRRRRAREADKLPDDLAEKYRPTAKERIEAIQEKLKTAEDPAQKRRYLAEIIAARQAVGAQRGSLFGGDSRLNDTLDPGKVNLQAQEIDGYLAMMPQKTLDTLAQQALNGHGGEMTETYKKENTYSKQLANAEANAQVPGAPQLSPSRLMVLSMEAQTNPNGTINEKTVRENAGQLESRPGYQQVAASPETGRLIREGDFGKLAVNMLQALEQPQQQGEGAKEQVLSPVNKAGPVQNV